MFLVYGIEERGSFDPSLRPNPSKAYLRHLGNLLYLEFIERETGDNAERAQARTEIEVARKKMEHFARLFNVVDVAPQVAKLRADWSSRRS